MEGEEIVDKYVTKVKEKESVAAHVGGALENEETPLEDDYKLNKHGIGTRDY